MEILVMNESHAKTLAHELTIDYIRANRICLIDTKDKIPNMVDNIANVNYRFYEAIINNKTLHKLY